MKKTIALLSSITLLVSLGCSQNQMADPKSATYTSEAALPEGWPAPGPYNQATKKTYPAYRAAFTDGKGSNSSFFTLFRHIKSQDIPMTSPVEMKMDKSANDMEMTQMAFLYRNQEVGQAGRNGEKVTVKDIPSQAVVSYAWMGKQTDENTAIARKAIEAELKKQNLTASSYRLLGYNGPGTKAAKRTYELQAMLKK